MKLYCDKINIYESLIPAWNRDIDLGHTSQPFDNLYLNNLVLNGSSIVGVDNNTITMNAIIRRVFCSDPCRHHPFATRRPEPSATRRRGCEQPKTEVPNKYLIFSLYLHKTGLSCLIAESAAMATDDTNRSYSYFVARTKSYVEEKCVDVSAGHEDDQGKAAYFVLLSRLAKKLDSSTDEWKTFAWQHDDLITKKGKFQHLHDHCSVWFGYEPGYNLDEQTVSQCRKQLQT